jgi:hypothetical protein
MVEDEGVGGVVHFVHLLAGVMICRRVSIGQRGLER